MFFEMLLSAVVGLNATDLTVETVRTQTQNVVSAYEVRGLKVQVSQIEVNNPSPLLTRASPTQCTIMLNTGNTARFVWGKFVDTKDVSEESAIQGFALAHEMGHCLLAKARRNEIELPQLTSQLQSAGSGGYSFAVNTLVGRKAVSGGENRYDETFSDLLGLHYVSMKHPEHLQLVLSKLKAARESFAGADQAHHSTPFLNQANLRLVDQFIAQTQGRGLTDDKFAKADLHLAALQ
jgi:hypothetical protein